MFRILQTHGAVIVGLSKMQEQNISLLETALAWMPANPIVDEFRSGLQLFHQAKDSYEIFAFKLYQ